MQFGLKEETIERIRAFLITQPEIEKAILYGSRAKGNFKNGSDIDLTLMGEGITQKNLFILIDQIDELMLPYTFDISIFDHVSNPDFREHVKRVGKVFYQKNS